MPRDSVDVAHPGQNAFNRLAHRQLASALSRAAKRHARGRLIDIGCGLKPYRGLVAPYVSEHVGVDHPGSPHAASAVDVLATAYDIPLPDESFDTALMSEVLEHLERPLDALVEAHRLLRPSGKIIVTTPLVWVLHEEPRDFYRFTPFGLEFLLKEAGFTSVTIEPLSGQWSTLSLMASYAVARSPLRRAPRLAAGLASGMQRLGTHLDDRWSNQPWMSWNHLAVAARP